MNVFTPNGSLCIIYTYTSPPAALYTTAKSKRPSRAIYVCTSLQNIYMYTRAYRAAAAPRSFIVTLRRPPPLKRRKGCAQRGNECRKETRAVDEAATAAAASCARRIDRKI